MPQRRSVASPSWATSSLACMPDPTLFDQVERDPLLRTMDAVIAPVAASANALVDDMEQREIAAVGV
jgi:hypothetical protein